MKNNAQPLYRSVPHRVEILPHSTYTTLLPACSVSQLKAYLTLTMCNHLKPSQEPLKGRVAEGDHVLFWLLRFTKETFPIDCDDHGKKIRSLHSPLTITSV